MEQCSECGVMLFSDGSDSILSGFFTGEPKLHKCAPFYECIDLDDYERFGDDDSYWSNPIRANSAEEAVEKWFDSGDPVSDGENADVVVKAPDGAITKHSITAYYDISFSVEEYK